MNPASVLRHRTAMVRHSLSQPMSLAVRHGLVRPGVSVLDYGCGQGDDLRALAAAGVDATGWDPHYMPEGALTPAQVVNLGFVLNVIEDPAERIATLRTAWNLSTQVLLASVMVVGAVPVDGLRPFGDGYMTARGTFQKYYQQAELKALLAQTTGTDPVALAPGIFAVFRSPEEEQEFLLGRRRGRRASTSEYRSGRTRRPSAARPELADRIAGAVEAIAELALQRGRPPRPVEVQSGVHDLLATERVAFPRAVDVAMATIEDRQLGESAAQRREDLLVHQALNILNRTGSANRPSPAMVRDIRHHFGSQQRFAEEALGYLHALADPERTAAAMRRAAGGGLGALDEDGRLVIDSGRVADLEGALRCYIGCAVYLSGEIEEEHLVRLDPLRRRVTFFTLTGRRQPFPRTGSAVNVDLKRQNVALSGEQRTLVRKADVFGMASRSRQRSAEAERRAASGEVETKVLVRT